MQVPREKVRVYALVPENVKQVDILDVVYPAGSVYITSDEAFNPNTEFNIGKWEKIESGIENVYYWKRTSETIDDNDNNKDNEDKDNKEDNEEVEQVYFDKLRNTDFKPVVSVDVSGISTNAEGVITAPWNYTAPDRCMYLSYDEENGYTGLIFQAVSNDTYCIGKKENTFLIYGTFGENKAIKRVYTGGQYGNIGASSDTFTRQDGDLVFLTYDSNNSKLRLNIFVIRDNAVLENSHLQYTFSENASECCLGFSTYWNNENSTQIVKLPVGVKAGAGLNKSELTQEDITKLVEGYKKAISS